MYINKLQQWKQPNQEPEFVWYLLKKRNITAQFGVNVTDKVDLTNTDGNKPDTQVTL